jgi:hypothetical protein
MNGEKALPANGHHEHQLREVSGAMERLLDWLAQHVVDDLVQSRSGTMKDKGIGNDCDHQTEFSANSAGEKPRRS